jgi:hypothetical protein
MWAVPMDIAPRGFGNRQRHYEFRLGAGGDHQPVVGGYLIDQTGNWQLPFLGSMVLMLVGMSLTVLMRPDQTARHGLTLPHPAATACNRMFFARLTSPGH